MRTRIVLSALLFVLLFSIGCSAYQIPYLSLDVRSEYTDSEIVINYTYVCEDRDQRCVYNLYDIAAPESVIAGDDGIFPSTGVLDFSDLVLGEGDYRLEFSVYSERDGEYSLLKFLEESYEFTIDFP